MRDMNPRNSIRDIPVSSSGHRRNSHQQERFEEDIPLPRRRKGSRRFLWIMLGIIVICAAAGLLLATLFEGATITITPKMQSITPPANIVALPNAGGGSLGYQTIALSQSATTTVNATGTSHVSKAASGVITISNVFSTAPQSLVANTRFAAGDGKIYKIHSAITIPGAKKSTSGTLTAGTITTTVYADVAGPDYNRPNATTFTIPGFKGGDKYIKITAQAAAGAIQGGFVGDQPSISEVDMKNAQATLQKTLDASLRSSVGTQIPNGFMPVQGSLAVDYSDISQSKGEGTVVNLSQTAHASMAMVNASSLASVLARLLVTGYSGEAVEFASPNPLILQVSTSTGNVTTGPLNLLLQGNPTLVWQFDKQALKAALLGKDKNAFEEVISTFAPAIEKAKASIRPFWKGHFPTDESKLGVVIDAQ
ncbi:hypothetical protein K2Q00_01970 [Patescibacteria group bacterium]|nr:hypothetical protein [Patescibacteria group bacterium]